MSDVPPGAAGAAGGARGATTTVGRVRRWWKASALTARAWRSPGLRARLGLVATMAIVALSAFVLLVAPVIGELRRELAVEREVVVAATEDVAALTNAVRDQETGQRGYLIARQEVYLEPYLRGREAAAARLAALERYTDVAGLPEAVTGLRAALERWQSEAAEPEIRLARFGANLEDSLADGEGVRLFEGVRDGLAAVERAVDQEAVRVRERIDTVLDRLLTTVLGLFAVTGVAALVVTGLLRRWITVPVADLVRQVGRVRDGDLDAPVAITGPAELVAVAEATETMRAEIVQQLREVTRAREALEQRAPAVVALRRELEPSMPDLPPGMTVDAFFEPAEGLLAGDFSDVVALPGGGIAVVVADASGHGADVVVRALRCKFLLATALLDGSGPADAFAAVAPRLADREGSFVSAVVVVVEPGGVLRWANAGHPPALVRSAGGTEQLVPTGPVLGPVPGPWEERCVEVTGSWSVVAYSDGLVEARRGDRSHFGEEGIEAVLARLATGDALGEAGPGPIIAGLTVALRGFLAGARPTDDITMVVATGTAPSTGPPLP